MFIRGYSWSILVAVVFWSSFTLAEPPPIRGAAGLPYHIKADSLSYDDTTKTYSARDHVTITRGNQSLQADAIDLHAETMDAEAWGQVRFISGQDWLTGSRLKMNLDKGVGVLYDGILFVKESLFYIKGNKIEKIGEDSYYIDDGRFTSCDGDRPAWQITGKDLKVKIDGYGTVRHAAFWAKSIPVLYSPFLVFPAKTERQTGFLMPQISNSNRNGFEYRQPFFWAISENSDATFYETYMDRRGLKHGIEYRYVLGSESKGTAMFDFLDDQQIDDGTVSENDSGYHYEGFRGDDEDRLNRDRWWFRMKGDQTLFAGVKAKLDIDLVSDQDYLREFTDGYSGFDSSDSYFKEAFGRDLDDYTDTVRLNQLSLNRNWDQFSLNSDFRWYDNVIVRKNSDPDPTLQRLPHVQLDGLKQQLFASPVYFDLESSYDYFWRDYGTRGHRADLHPRLYYPMRFWEYFDFEPSVGFRETLWHVEDFHDEPSKKEDQLLTREVFDFRADLSTEFWKTFDVSRGSIDRIRHTIKPRIVYDYIPVPDQKEFPNFEGIDRIGEKNILTYSVTNYFTARSVKGHSPNLETHVGSSDEPVPSLYRYTDICRIKVSQSYDIAEARRDDGTDSKRPFSDIKGEVEFRPYQCLDLDGDVTWSPYDDEFNSYNAALTLCDRRGDRLSVDYLFSRGTGESILAFALVRLLHPVSVYGEYERNIQDGQNIRTVVGFKYEPQCWSFDFRYKDDRTMDNQEYFVEISLYGLGQIGL